MNNKKRKAIRHFTEDIELSIEAMHDDYKKFKRFIRKFEIKYENMLANAKRNLLQLLKKLEENNNK